MKIVTLMENTACDGCLTAEHGLSLYIETGDRKILFDAGESGAFADNAEKLGVDLSRVDFAVLSHGHHDHGNGLVRFRQINPDAPIYLHKDAFAPRYNVSGKFVGVDPELRERGGLIFTEGERSIAPGIMLYTHIDLPHPIDPAGLLMVENGQRVPEDFRHEQYLLIEEQGKRVLFSGCSHKGILNIARYFRPDILIGGFHFMKQEDKAVLQNAAETLLTLPTVYYTGHCTGQMQYAYLKTIMGQRLHYLPTGSVLDIGV